MQIRSRIVAREFKSGDRADLYAGTPPLEALKAVISIAASHSPEFSLMHVDVSRAYSLAKAQRVVLLKVLAEGCSRKDKGKIGLLKKNMYGTRDGASKIGKGSDSDWAGDKETRKASFAGVALVGRHLSESYRRKQKIITRNSAETELHAAAAKVVQSKMCDLGFAIKLVLIIDAKATEHILHRHGIGKMKRIDEAHLWLQDEVKSNRLKVRRVMREHNLADIGKKALSIRTHATSMVYDDAKENLKSGDAIGLWVGMTNQSKSQLVDWPNSSSGSEEGSPRVTKRGNSKPVASPICGPSP